MLSFDALLFRVFQPIVSGLILLNVLEASCFRAKLGGLYRQMHGLAANNDVIELCHSAKCLHSIAA